MTLFSAAEGHLSQCLVDGALLSHVAFRGTRGNRLETGVHTLLGRHDTVAVDQVPLRAQLTRYRKVIILP